MPKTPGRLESLTGADWRFSAENRFPDHPDEAGSGYRGPLSSPDEATGKPTKSAKTSRRYSVSDRVPGSWLGHGIRRALACPSWKQCDPAIGFLPPVETAKPTWGILGAWPARKADKDWRLSAH
jgi:hypothetical protein